MDDGASCDFLAVHDQADFLKSEGVLMLIDALAAGNINLIELLRVPWSQKTIQLVEDEIFSSTYPDIVSAKFAGFLVELGVATFDPCFAIATWAQPDAVVTHTFSLGFRSTPRAAQPFCFEQSRVTVFLPILAFTLYVSWICSAVLSAVKFGRSPPTIAVLHI
jgi:hypothetical protein